MSEEGARPRWRDVLVVVVLAVVIVAGLVHYGRGLAADEPGSGTDDNSSSTSAPQIRAQAQLEGAAPTDPATPATPATSATPVDSTCWDGRQTTSLALCGLPDGARGLAWVFPSFAEDRPSCHRARPNADSYPVVQSYECFQRALGEPVTVTYDQVEDIGQVERWLVSRLGEQHRRELPGAHGGRWIFKDGRSRPARITGMYERFPYVVSVYASTPQAAQRAWKMIVRQRPPQAVRGVRV
jgi:hypothetical protein